ncbi:MAG TPA: CRTAC1 family protein [Fimbriiglobus sp.]|jgi:hypothetical protein
MNRPVKWVVGVVLAAGIAVGVYRLVGPKNSRTPVGPAVDVGGTAERRAVPVPDVRFTDVTASAGLRFTHFNGAAGQKLLPETMGGGVAVIDFDGDGKPDLFFTNGCPWPGHQGPTQAPCLALYRNKGDGTFEDVTAAVGLNVSMYAVGCCVGDYDNDGFPDLFVTGVGGDRLFHNEGGKRFVDVTATAKVGGAGGWPKDLSAEAFLRHAPPIPFGSSATFVDYDGDGKLDLFVCRYCTWSPAIDLSIHSTLTGVGRTYLQPTSLEGSYCVLYRNKGDGTFEDVSAASGIQVAEPEGTDANAKLRPVGKSLGVIVCDPDGDGWPDLIVANDTVRNFLFHNVPDGKGGRKFEEIGMSAGVAYALGTPRGAMGIDVGEYRPGKSAVVIGNFANEPNSFLSLINPGRLLFSDQASTTGLDGPSRGPLKFGAFFFDYDLDGRLDLLTCNGHIDPDIHRVQSSQTYKQSAQLFWNTGDEVRTFELVTTAASGPDLFQPLIGRGCAFLDFDGDGDLDVVLTDNDGPARLLRNDQKLGHHWIRLTLEGDGTTSNRSAIGAEVVVEAGGKTMIRTVTGAKGYLSQSELTVTVGLDSTTKVDTVTVRWPGKAGLKQTWTGLGVDGTYILRQNQPAAQHR